MKQIILFFCVVVLNAFAADPEVIQIKGQGGFSCRSTDNSWAKGEFSCVFPLPNPKEIISSDPPLAKGYFNSAELRPLDVKMKVEVRAQSMDLDGFTKPGRTLKEVNENLPKLSDLPAGFLEKLTEISVASIVVPPGTKLYDKDLKKEVVTLDRNVNAGHTEVCTAKVFFRSMTRLGHMNITCEREGKTWQGSIDGATPVIRTNVKVSFGAWDKPAVKTVILEVENPSQDVSDFTYSGVSYGYDTQNVIAKLEKETGSSVKEVEFFKMVLPKGTALYQEHPDLPRGYKKITHRIGE